MAEETPSVAPERRSLHLLVPALAIVVLLAALVGVQLVRPVPRGELRLSVPDSLTLPGQVTDVPWPAQGQARLDVDGLGTLGGSGADRPIPIGSVAKVMTAYVVLADHPLAPGQAGPSITVTAADVDDYESRIPGGQSLVAVEAGQPLTERQALEALLLPSANNVAQILAKWDAGSVEAFVAKMNAAAVQLGLVDTHYTDPSGLAPSTVSTADDQTVLAQRALTMPAFAEIVALPSTVLPVAGAVTNYNSLLGTDGVVGVKTGSTDEAGGNLVFAARLTVAGRTLTVVGAVLGQPGTGTPQQLAAANGVTRGLLAAARRLVQTYPALPAGTVGQVRGAWGASVAVRTAAPVQIVGWPGLTVGVRAKPAEFGGRPRAGQVVGALTVHTGLGDTAVDLTAGGTLSEPSAWWRLTRTR
ncbi:D-alanyl-D-alanine carboxypeptidase family protein [Planosporangium mesophilum]|uniref:D-alanyl-D-alanine carboxypeptidase family protein n=1 Tax=Planosporangium mesophilum TaxID=689768 RepID=UPI001EF3379A|nr:D-alanyl-D-alanine carboxypeptidase [Planosporangium mesophilum]